MYKGFVDRKIDKERGEGVLGVWEGEGLAAMELEDGNEGLTVSSLSRCQVMMMSIGAR